jgi:hypothetical protein
MRNLSSIHSNIPKLNYIKELTGDKIRKAIVDSEYKVKVGIPGVDIIMPRMLKREYYNYLNNKRKERCRSRTRIEGLIYHI